MADLSTIYRLSLVALVCLVQACSCACPVLDCWFVQERVGRGGGLTAPTTQEKSLLHVRKSGQRVEPGEIPSDISPDKVFHVTDPAGTLCHADLDPPRGSIRKPLCEVNPFLPQPSTVKWAAPLTAASTSPLYLQADWLSSMHQGLSRQLTVASILRAPTASREHSVILSVSSKTPAAQSKLGEPVTLDCRFWVEPSSPLADSGFAVEWRYQFRGEGRLVLAYDGKSDRLAEPREDGATLDFDAVHGRGDASLTLRGAQVRHSGMYICTVYLPYVVAQVTMELDVVEPPSLSLHPSPLPLAVPGQILTVQCEASGFSPLSLDLSWQFKDAAGQTRPLGSGSVTGHRQAWDGTYSQSSRLDIDPAAVELGSGGQLTCVAVHQGGTRMASTTVSVAGFSSPSIEDSMAMVGVALVLYGLIKFVSWTFTSSDSDEPEKKTK